MIYLSVCSRRENQPPELSKLENLEGIGPNDDIQVLVCYDAESIYDGHKSNLSSVDQYLDDNDIIVLVHDDVEIISNSKILEKALRICRKPGVGFVGVAGAVNLNTRAIWWESRLSNESRGFVFQGRDVTTMSPNNFGPYGQVVVLDGCLIAATYGTLKKIGLDQPSYLTSKWDFYDLHLTFKAHMLGLSNFAIPVTIRHSSEGSPREGWNESRLEFIREHGKWLPCKLPMDKTQGVPK
jgi:hypothetical protein